MWFRKRKKVDAAATSRELRDQALSTRASELGLRPNGSRVWGILMETGYPEAVATLVAFADGTTSLYFSSGGGTIGAGDHIAVRTVAESFLRAADEHLLGAAVAEVPDATVFEEAADDASHANPLADAGHAGTKRGEAAHDQIDLDARL